MKRKAKAKLAIKGKTADRRKYAEELVELETEKYRTENARLRLALKHEQAREVRLMLDHVKSRLDQISEQQAGMERALVKAVTAFDQEFAKYRVQSDGLQRRANGKLEELMKRDWTAQ